MTINFTQARSRGVEDVGYFDIDLSIARTKPEALGIGGRTLFIATLAYDSKYVISTTKTIGTALLTLNEPDGVPIEAYKGMFYDFGLQAGVGVAGQDVSGVGVFDEVYIRNTAQAGAMMRIFYSTQTQIKPFSTEFEISDTDTHTKLDTLISSMAAMAINVGDIESLITNDELKRKSLSTLDGATYATAANTTNTVVSAGANTNGVIIRRCVVTTNTSTARSELRINGNPLTNGYVSGGSPVSDVVENFYIPAGNSVVLFSNAANYPAHLWYEKL